MILSLFDILNLFAQFFNFAFRRNHASRDLRIRRFRTDGVDLAVQPETIAHRFDIKDNTTIVEEEEP